MLALSAPQQPLRLRTLYGVEGWTERQPSLEVGATGGFVASRERDGAGVERQPRVGSAVGCGRGDLTRRLVEAAQAVPPAV